MNHRYILEPYNGIKSRHACPNCNHKHRFTRYIDTETGDYLASHVGKCDRADSCGYHYPPRDYFSGSGNVERGSWSHEPRHPNHYDTLPSYYVNDTTKSYGRNNFMLFLIRCLGEKTALRLAALYKIGTSKHWPGAAIFWQIDASENVRTGKIMLYNPSDGHRVKEPYNHIAWAHSLRVRGSGSEGRETASHEPRHTNPGPNFQLQQCFFGEHLLAAHPFRKVAITESEKTAILCSHFYPEFIWLAAGSLEGLSRNKCKVLKDRRVELFPDVNGFDKWKLKAREMSLRLPTADFTVNHTLERTATPDERANGIDLADRLITHLLNNHEI